MMRIGTNSTLKEAVEVAVAAGTGQKECATARTSLETAGRAPLSGKMEGLEVMANSVNGARVILETVETQEALLEAEAEVMVQEVPVEGTTLEGVALEAEAVVALRLTISLGSSGL